jgi:hypothetical protein
MQIYGVQCFNSRRAQGYIRLSHENSNEIKSQANGEEKKVKWMQFDLIIA